MKVYEIVEKFKDYHFTISWIHSYVFDIKDNTYEELTNHSKGIVCFYYDRCKNQNIYSFTVNEISKIVEIKFYIYTDIEKFPNDFKKRV